MLAHSIKPCPCTMCRFGMDSKCQSLNEDARKTNVATARARETATIEWLKATFTNATIEKE